jgi:hypothetical protein
VTPAERIEALSEVDSSILVARRCLHEIRGYTNWQALSPGARIVLRNVRDSLKRALDKVNAILGEGT